MEKNKIRKRSLNKSANSMNTSNPDYVMNTTIKNKDSEDSLEKKSANMTIFSLIIKKCLLKRKKEVEVSAKMRQV